MLQYHNGENYEVNCFLFISTLLVGSTKRVMNFFQWRQSKVIEENEKSNNQQNGLPLT